MTFALEDNSYACAESGRWHRPDSSGPSLAFRCDEGRLQLALAAAMNFFGGLFTRQAATPGFRAFPLNRCISCADVWYPDTAVFPGHSERLTLARC